MVTALHCAVINNHPRVILSLIKAGANTRLRDGVSDSPLPRRAERGVWQQEMRPTPPLHAKSSPAHIYLAPHQRLSPGNTEQYEKLTLLCRPSTRRWTGPGERTSRRPNDS